MNFFCFKGEYSTYVSLLSISVVKKKKKRSQALLVTDFNCKIVQNEEIESNVQIADLLLLLLLLYSILSKKKKKKKLKRKTITDRCSYLYNFQFN